MANSNEAIGMEQPRYGGKADEPRIVESETEARAGDRHNENLVALVAGTAVAAAILVLLYVLQVI